MQFEATITFVAACSLALGLGCATVEPIHRPPTPAEIDELNEAKGPLVVVIPTFGPPLTLDHVVLAEAEKLVVAAQDGPYFALRLNDVTRFSARSRSRG